MIVVVLRVLIFINVEIHGPRAAALWSTRRRHRAICQTPAVNGTFGLCSIRCTMLFPTSTKSNAVIGRMSGAFPEDTTGQFEAVGAGRQPQRSGSWRYSFGESDISSRIDIGRVSDYQIVLYELRRIAGNRSERIGVT